MDNIFEKKQTRRKFIKTGGVAAAGIAGLIVAVAVGGLLLAWPNTALGLRMQFVRPSSMRIQFNHTQPAPEARRPAMVLPGISYSSVFLHITSDSATRQTRQSLPTTKR